MSDVLFYSPAAVLVSFTGLYWICMIVGGGMLIVSTLAGTDADADVGGIDGDASLDVDVPVDATLDMDGATHPADGGLAGADGAHTAATTLATWLSMRFLIYFMAMFGVVGVVLTHMTEVYGTTTFVAALVSGMIVGQGVHHLLRKLERSSGNTLAQPRDYIRKIGRVTIAVGHSETGEVALRVGRTQRFVPARSKHADAAFHKGDQVAVVAYTAGVAEIVSREEFEFVAHDRAPEDDRGAND
ncbi:MAG: hypothetical protein ACE5E6_11380 [Phycisphaerae bacterium]